MDEGFAWFSWGATMKNGWQMLSQFNSVPYMLDQNAPFPEVKYLVLDFTEPHDKISKLFLLQHLPAVFPGLERLEFQWNSPRSRNCTKLARPLGRALHRWKYLRRFEILCPTPLMNMLRQKWRNADVDLSRIRISHVPQ